jgi:hypothetical protein
VLGYVVLAAAFCVWVWLGQDAPRRIEPLIVALGFSLFALTATRQVVWLGLIAFYVVRSCGARGALVLPHRVAVPALAAALLALVAWVGVWGPTPPEPAVMTSVAAYAVTHPALPGRIATSTGTGSYLLFRGAANPPVVDGRLENYTPAEIDGTYAVLRGDPAAVDRAVRDWHVTAVITRDQSGIEELPKHGFRLVFRNGEGAYLVRAGSTRPRPYQARAGSVNGPAGEPTRSNSPAFSAARWSSGRLMQNDPDGPTPPVKPDQRSSKSS